MASVDLHANCSSKQLVQNELHHTGWVTYHQH